MSLVSFVVIGFGIVLVAQQPDRARTEALARRAAERLQTLQREADELASTERTLLGDLRKFELDRQIKLEMVRRAHADADQASADLREATDRLTILNQQDHSERPELRARLVELYKLGQGRYLRLLLSTPDVRHIGDASRMVGTLAALDRKRVESHERTVASLKATRLQLERRSHDLDAARATAERAAAAATRAAESRNALVREIDRRRDLNAQLAGELQAAQVRLQLSLRDLAAGGSSAPPAALPLRPFRGDLPWPAEGPARRRTGPAGVGAGASKGIEIGAAEGSTVSAVHDGTVAYADGFTGFGNLVILDHGNQAFSLYGDLAEITVKRGARVDRGDALGTAGESALGQAGLYFELRIDGQAVNPLQWLRKR